MANIAKNEIADEIINEFRALKELYGDKTFQTTLFTFLIYELSMLKLADRIKILNAINQQIEEEINKR